ncbi:MULTISPECIES: GntR family transcriptional regulator [unclassified Geobacillus]|uniref:FadR/GntR family transcriptional regulator n=1 Tax=Geobacillus TaxID=129337 RepID=UPI0003FE303D|nr:MULTISPECIES: GntR family transcriptional regulator [unclassified Geobacillus]KDE47229.1 GntR family transcriptional regulator [Geobacillus sp. CAMR5420]
MDEAKERGHCIKEENVYAETLKHIRRMMAEDNLAPGDKLPSERELAERLGVGRSSVREALRALEFLGLIETRRGEGRYRREVGSHQLIDLLAMFLLENERAKADLAETKWLIERLLLALACRRRSAEDVDELKKIVRQKPIDFARFFETVVEAAGNVLLARIWRVLSGFAASFAPDPPLADAGYEQLLAALERQDPAETVAIWEAQRPSPLSKRAGHRLTNNDVHFR